MCVFASPNALFPLTHGNDSTLYTRKDRVALSQVPSNRRRIYQAHTLMSGAYDPSESQVHWFYSFFVLDSPVHSCNTGLDFCCGCGSTRYHLPIVFLGMHRLDVLVMRTESPIVKCPFPYLWADQPHIRSNDRIDTTTAK